MATNKHSCAVNFAVLLSLTQMAYLLFVSYSSAMKMANPADWMKAMLKLPPKQTALPDL